MSGIRSLRTQRLQLSILIYIPHSSSGCSFRFHSKLFLPPFPYDTALRYDNFPVLPNAPTPCLLLPLSPTGVGGEVAAPRGAAAAVTVGVVGAVTGAGAGDTVTVEGDTGVAGAVEGLAAGGAVGGSRTRAMRRLMIVTGLSVGASGALCGRATST